MAAEARSASYEFRMHHEAGLWSKDVNDMVQSISTNPLLREVTIWIPNLRLHHLVEILTNRHIQRLKVQLLLSQDEILPSDARLHHVVIYRDFNFQDCTRDARCDGLANNRLLCLSPTYYLQKLTLDLTRMRYLKFHMADLASTLRANHCLRHLGLKNVIRSSALAKFFLRVVRNHATIVSLELSGDLPSKQLRDMIAVTKSITKLRCEYFLKSKSQHQPQDTYFAIREILQGLAYNQSIRSFCFRCSHNNDVANTLRDQDVMEFLRYNCHLERFDFIFNGEQNPSHPIFCFYQAYLLAALAWNATLQHSNMLKIWVHDGNVNQVVDFLENNQMVQSLTIDVISREIITQKTMSLQACHMRLLMQALTCHPGLQTLCLEIYLEMMPDVVSVVRNHASLKQIHITIYYTGHLFYLKSQIGTNVLDAWRQASLENHVLESVTISQRSYSAMPDMQILQPVPSLTQLATQRYAAGLDTLSADVIDAIPKNLARNISRSMAAKKPVELDFIETIPKNLVRIISRIMAKH